jgi:hypothetical protein
MSTALADIAHGAITSFSNGYTSAPPIGHNNPPPDAPTLAELLDPAILTDQLKIDHADLLTRTNQLLDAAARYHDTQPNGPATEDEAGKAADFVKQIKACAKIGTDMHAETKRPFLECGRVVDAVLKQDVADALSAAARRIEDKISIFLRRKVEAARRLAHEEARRRELEAAALAAAAARETNEQRAADLAARAVEVADASDAAAKRATASDTDLGRTRGVFGSVTSVRSNWTFEVEDIKALALAVVNGEVPPNYITTNDVVVRGVIKPKQGLRKIPGLRIFDDARASVR